MQLTVRDVARMLQVTERTVHRWLAEAELPAHRVGGQFRFNRDEVFEWAATKLALPSELLDEQQADPSPADGLAAALAAGGVLYDVPGDDRPSALRAVVERLNLPDGFDRQRLLALLLTRETLGSTGVGDGIAIPHPRYPVVLSVPAPCATLCYLKRPIEFAAPDGKPVDTLFMLISPTVRRHLKLLAQIATALHDETFRKLVRSKAAAERLVREARRFHAPPPASAA